MEVDESYHQKTLQRLAAPVVAAREDLMMRDPFDLLREAYRADPDADPAQLARRVLAQISDAEIERVAKRAALCDWSEVTEDDYHDLALEELVTGVYDMAFAARLGRAH